MNTQIKDMRGLTFGRLTVLFLADHRIGRLAAWHCRCECGAVPVVAGAQLRKGRTRSCGCLQRDTVSAMRRIHMDSDSVEFKTWARMLNRCYNTRTPAYPQYGGRGIRVCARWRHSFPHFLSDMGRRPHGRSLDRLNTNGPYSPSNCRWATKSEQMRNRRPFARTGWKTGIKGSVAPRAYVAVRVKSGKPK